MIFPIKCQNNPTACSPVEKSKVADNCIVGLHYEGCDRVSKKKQEHLLQPIALFESFTDTFYKCWPSLCSLLIVNYALTNPRIQQHDS